MENVDAWRYLFGSYNRMEYTHNSGITLFSCYRSLTILVRMYRTHTTHNTLVHRGSFGHPAQATACILVKSCCASRCVLEPIYSNRKTVCPVRGLSAHGLRQVRIGVSRGCGRPRYHVQTNQSSAFPIMSTNQRISSGMVPSPSLIDTNQHGGKGYKERLRLSTGH